MNASPGPKQNTNNRNARLASSLEFSNDFLHVKLLAISAEFLITFRPAQKHRGILINICGIFFVNDPAVLDNTSWECGKITFQFEYLKMYLVHIFLCSMRYFHMRLQDNNSLRETYYKLQNSKYLVHHYTRSLETRGHFIKQFHRFKVAIF